jgi:hypothetical protein
LVRANPWQKGIFRTHDVHGIRRRPKRMCEFTGITIWRTIRIEWHHEVANHLYESKPADMNRRSAKSQNSASRTAFSKLSSRRLSEMAQTATAVSSRQHFIASYFIRSSVTARDARAVPYVLPSANEREKPGAAPLRVPRMYRKCIYRDMGDSGAPTSANSHIRGIRITRGRERHHDVPTRIETRRRTAGLRCLGQDRTGVPALVRPAVL